jgi:hypothetical protein
VEGSGGVPGEKDGSPMIYYAGDEHQDWEDPADELDEDAEDWEENWEMVIELEDEEEEDDEDDTELWWPDDADTH